MNFLPDASSILNKNDLNELNDKIKKEKSRDLEGNIDVAKVLNSKQLNQFNDKLMDELELKIKKEMVKCFNPNFTFNK